MRRAGRFHVRCHARSQSGMATLLVVMGLFFLVSMVAAYTSRNLIFEQRTSANQYRATQAFEAAEAGLEWTLAMLNGGRVDREQCAAPEAGSSVGSFRQRYVSDLINTSTPPGAPGAAPTPMPWCQLTAAGAWICGCPDTEVASAVVTTAASPPAFRVRFRDIAVPYPRYFTIESRGCTSPDEACLTDARVRGAGSGAAALVSIRAALVPALAALPQAALTVQQELREVNGKAVNTEAVANGVTIQHGGQRRDENLVPISVAGSGGTASTGVVQDSNLAGLSADALFERYFGMSRLRFAAQASTVRACADTASCSFSEVLAVADANPGRPVWVPGDLDVDSAQALGSDAAPVLLAVGGTLRISASAQIVGMVFSQGDLDFASGASLIRGAVLTAGNARGTGTVYAVYDHAVMERIRNTQGTIVRVPGSWKDF